MGAGEHEGRALDRAADAQPVADPARERRLAGAERPGEHDEVAGTQLPAEVAPERLHRLGVVDGAAHHGASRCVRGTRGPMRVTIS
ncbi:hypothetical protein GCM10025870_26170 [Agromyces marinus]|uniref:Uncharacterized protein n=1 Tax=Agromyces marinus TaxID=1389020 RepID=A0ABM8H403_9MICO|nr:hypothetical protein GCM10025870_26170 [Agromyces marinus]